MAQFRAQVTLERADSPVRDWIVNTFYLDTDLGSDPQALCDDIPPLWDDLEISDFTAIRARLYQIDGSGDPSGPPVAESLLDDGTVGSGHGGPPGPREVALCLSYYAGANTPRKRGRLYIGPFRPSLLNERPSTALRDNLGQLASGLSGLGGPNVQWVQHSTVAGDFSNVTNWYVDDEWDTIRSRGRVATTRTAGTVDG